MDSILIAWNEGEGNIVINSEDGNTVLISSDTTNEGVERSQVLTFKTTTGDASVTLTVIQKGKRVILRDSSDNILRDKEGNVLTALKNRE